MTLDTFWDIVQARFIEHLNVDNKSPYQNNRWRWGQTCMNVLRVEKPSIYVRLTGGIADPWNADVSSPTYARFVNFIMEHWDD